ncbi:hypothetical protein CB1_000698015 [Camelus ferus]|nr:hypothetical protein CB1_000698015 [Camelus ferus]
MGRQTPLPQRLGECRLCCAVQKSVLNRLLELGDSEDFFKIIHSGPIQMWSMCTEARWPGPPPGAGEEISADPQGHLAATTGITVSRGDWFVPQAVYAKPSSFSVIAKTHRALDADFGFPDFILLS